MNLLTAFETELIGFINRGLQLHVIGDKDYVSLRPYRDGFAHVFESNADISKRILVFFGQDRLYLNSLIGPTHMRQLAYGNISALGLAVDIVNGIIDEYSQDHLLNSVRAQQAAWN